MDPKVLFSDKLSLALGSTYFRIGSEHWHTDELITLQQLLLIHAPSLKEGLLWWCKAISLFDRHIYVEPENNSGFLSLHIKSRTNSALPIWVHYLTEALLKQVAQFTTLNHSWLQTNTCSYPQIRNEYGQCLKIHFDSHEIGGIATPEPRLFTLSKQVLLLLQHENIEKEDLVSRLKKVIRDNISSPIRLPEQAIKLGLSPRTLQRRLRDQHLSFSALVDEEKKAIALQLLADTQLSTTTIANRLGYDDPSNFHRAFRKWYPFTPQKYREQCRNNRAIQQAKPIRLHYAKGIVESDDDGHPREGRVWIEVDNIAFEKNVTVECKDRDGVWRNYPAFFDDFLSEGVELWSTANLPVASPLSFRLCYEVDGQKFIDDNLGHNYVVSNQILLGHPLIVVPTRATIPEAGNFRAVIELACRVPDTEAITCVIDDQEDVVWTMTKTSQHHDYSSWTLSALLTTIPQQCSFTLFNQQGNEFHCDNYQHGYRFARTLT
ncbi:AraC family transcriptional regulator [Photobacterium sp. SDRW27]|uniref:helix-turn-helix transcriptional regulator n=1 Tax=Photobacterium obscurum TaxID=2829490 RepID=UPI00224421A7|nr:AraC family transcriptional regulator [Photobacterium obscurum]MCW8329451.1 AraC family transcriptional regulator [Photobacterium obscurum]